MPMQLCRASSLGEFGAPRAAMYFGEAHSSRRFGARRRAITRESGASPNRTQTSNASSLTGGGCAESCSWTST
jgi:hypothetical protein